MILYPDLQVGIANLGNSLAAIKKLVYEEKRLSKEELLEALENNFEGEEGEKIRQLLLNYAPKYGNDDDYVDLLLKDAYMEFIDELESITPPATTGGPSDAGTMRAPPAFRPMYPAARWFRPLPMEGRPLHPVAEGSSPSSGTDRWVQLPYSNPLSKLPTGKDHGRGAAEPEALPCCHSEGCR